MAASLRSIAASGTASAPKPADKKDIPEIPAFEDKDVAKKLENIILCMESAIQLKIQNLQSQLNEVQESTEFLKQKDLIKDTLQNKLSKWTFRLGRAYTNVVNPGRFCRDTYGTISKYLSEWNTWSAQYQTKVTALIEDYRKRPPQEDFSQFKAAFAAMQKQMAEMQTKFVVLENKLAAVEKDNGLLRAELSKIRDAKSVATATAVNSSSHFRPATPPPINSSFGAVTHSNALLIANFPDTSSDAASTHATVVSSSNGL